MFGKRMPGNVAPPPGPKQKPVWSYDKKDAAKLSKAACEITAERINKSGYKTELQIDKGSPNLTVIDGKFGAAAKGAHFFNAARANGGNSIERAKFFRYFGNGPFALMVE